MLTRTSDDGYCAVCAAIRDADLTATTAALELPCLAIAGSEDGSTPPDLLRATADLIPGSTFHVIDDAGHLPCIEQPEATAAVISTYLRDIGHS